MYAAHLAADLSSHLYLFLWLMSQYKPAEQHGVYSTSAVDNGSFACHAMSSIRLLWHRPCYLAKNASLSSFPSLALGETGPLSDCLVCMTLNEGLRDMLQKSQQWCFLPNLKMFGVPLHQCKNLRLVLACTVSQLCIMGSGVSIYRWEKGGTPFSRATRCMEEDFKLFLQDACFQCADRASNSHVVKTM